MLQTAFRSLRRSPGFAAAVVATVAVGIGPGAALFGVVKAVLLNPLPYPNPHELVWVTSVGANDKESATSMPNFDDWRSRTRCFAKLAAYADAPMLTSGGEFPERTASAIVTEDFFEVLGVRPPLGRTFLPSEHAKGSAFASVVISDAFWRRAYAADPAIIGRKIRVLGFQSTVVGVMPPGFAYPEGVDLWVSARALGEGGLRNAPNYRVIGRLRSETSYTAANSELAAVARLLKTEYPDPLQPETARVVPLRQHLTGDLRTPLLVVFGAVGILLLLVCVNVANLLLARGSARAVEIAVRVALGADFKDIFRYLIGESLLLSITGGAIGLLLAAWCLELLRIVLPAGIPRWATIEIDTGVCRVFDRHVDPCRNRLRGIPRAARG